MKELPWFVFYINKPIKIHGIALLFSASTVGFIQVSNSVIYALQGHSWGFVNLGDLAIKWKHLMLNMKFCRKM